MHDAANRRLRFKVILPAIVQNIIDKQDMPVKGGAFVAMSSDKLKINLDTVLDTPLPARIDPTKLSLYNKKTPGFFPFVNVTLPEQHLDGTTDVIVKDQIVTVSNETELITWFEDVFDYPSVDLSFRGDPVVNLGKLKSTAHIDKTVQAKSLNKLKGFAIEQLSLVVPPAENGTNIEGTLNLPNWGTLTIGIGDLSLNLMSGDIRIGLITVYDVYIPPGNNSKYFNGQLYFDTLIQNFGTILTSQGDALSSGNVQIDATGNATVVDGQHIGFVEAVLNNRRVTSTAPIVKLLGDVVGSVTGSNVSLSDMIGGVFGNSSLVEDILSHWNVTKSAQETKRSQPTLRKGINSRTAMNLFKIGMKSIGIGKR